MVKEIIAILLSALLTENFVMVKFYGICPFLGVSKKTDTAIGMGMAVTFVMGIASLFTYLANTYLLVPFGLEYLQTILFILIIAGLVQLVEMFVKKSMPPLYDALGIYLPLITTNCAVLSAALLNVQNEYNLLYSVLFGVFAGLGFTLAIVLMAGIREYIDENAIPVSFRGFPIALLTAGLMAIGFMGFSGFSI
ncbi:MAG TPA: electron transport complex subunit RsxA [Candidatus Ornithomonoglobus intestinigallinarum]|uniref:Ion-translocating oxidoreductase complex subunit A n=1 Tax=Candidatus Ornithomonoglobus intestinigallinarum TaxID=2840894 RepID=A0A9D1H2F2_9FIRM|nr:electron transport complex subunit RsxA [Candidatus Ornithomonoglobus intestinigallinarum]